ncbi:F-box/LRR-repeat protein At3g59190-like [Silene latifolia]|uniref:F-box/LRR-repeat protein At3g59190-like n=1 Tax=Silene latifolia TaxID=37657 RepID=UPI003D7795C2
MASMDSNLKRCCVDRLTSLHDDLLTRILSMLPTKDAAATQVLSKRMKQSFCCITSIDLDDSPISYCVERHPHLVERFSLFESFVDNVLHKLSLFQQPLTRFRLHLGGDKKILARSYYKGHRCKKDCFPDPQPTRLYTWISYPLAHCGLRELDLSFHVRNPCEYKLPPELFVSQSLEVLRLGSNLEINNETDFLVICLPNLKLLHLHSFELADDDFVTRLVSSCPALEDLSITYCWWSVLDCVIISSHSIRRFALVIFNYDDEMKNSDLVLIDTPNLEYFKYTGNVPHKFSFAHMNALVEAYMFIEYPLQFDTLLPSFRVQLSLAKALSNVQQLSLLGILPEIFFFAAELKDQLPTFHNLRFLKLGSLLNKFCSGRWDIVLLLILQCSPLLETLIFPEGFFEHSSSKFVSDLPDDVEAATLEADGWRTIERIPSCCKSHLKKIVISYCCGCDQEVNMMKFLLGNTSVLKEFVICLPIKNRIPCDGVRSEAPNFDQYEKTIEELPRASNSCSIIYCSEPLYPTGAL